jgi:hypothetical protein
MVGAQEAKPHPEYVDELRHSGVHNSSSECVQSYVVVERCRSHQTFASVWTRVVARGYDKSTGVHERGDGASTRTHLAPYFPIAGCQIKRATGTLSGHECLIQRSSTRGRREVVMSERNLDYGIPDFDETQIHELARCTDAAPKLYRDGQTLFAVGDRDINFFIVKSGEVEILDYSDDEPKTVTIHRMGQFTGDISHLTGLPAIVSGVARGDCEVYEVSGAALRAS